MTILRALKRKRINLRIYKCIPIVLILIRKERKFLLYENVLPFIRMCVCVCFCSSSFMKKKDEVNCIIFL